MPAPRKTPRLPTARGEITWVGLALLFGLLGGAYLAWVWVPVYLVHYEVQQVVRQFGNQAVKTRDDAQLVEAMIGRLRSLDQVEVVEADGHATRRPVVDVRPQDVTWERLDPATLHVAFAYDREVRLPLLDRWIERVMSVDLSLDVSAPDWGASR